MDPNDWRGIWTSLVTPLNSDSSIDWNSLDSIVSRQLEAEVRALVMAGRCGEGSTLSAHEKLALVRRASSSAKRRGHTLVVGAVEGTSTTQSLELCKLYQDAGADGILAYFPLDFPFVDRGILSHFKCLASSVSIPIFICFPNPCDPFLLSSHFVDELLNLPGVLGACMVEEAASLYSSSLKSQKLFLSHSETSFFSGQHLDKSSFFGGVVSCLANVFPRELKAICPNHDSSKSLPARPSEAALVAFARSLEKYPIASAIKGCLHQQGILKPFLRLPFDTLPEDSLRGLLAELQKITNQLEV